MGNEILNLVAVNLSLMALVIVPFIPCAMMIQRGVGWPQILLTSMTLGSCLQAITGLLWSDLAGAQPYMELALLTIIWCTSLFWCVRDRKRFRPDPVHFAVEASPRYFPLLLVLALAFAVRSIHPLEAAYLGQSDGYTHLGYLRSIVERGHLLNPSYPSGYHWILALPVLVFSIEPYWVARFAGGFFGVGLVLGIFVLVERMFNRRSAYFASFVVACFPPMTLLMKTGVGAFANQFGLFLLPATFFFYYRFVTDQGRGFRDSGLLVLCLAGIAAAVPMMLLHVIIILALHRLLDLRRLSPDWVSKSAVIALAVTIPVVLVLFHMTSVGPGQRLQTAKILVEYKEKKRQPEFWTEAAREAGGPDQQSAGAGSRITRQLKSSPYYGLVVDYFSFKRLGFGNVGLNTLGGALGVLFFGLSLYGLTVRNTGCLILGLWGGVTVVQTTFGFLQFSAYQREGWSLLVAVCCLSGVIADWLYEKIPGHALPRLAAGTLMGGAIIWAFMSPPRHGPIKSSAEDILVRSIRYLGQPAEQRVRDCFEQAGNECLIDRELHDELPLTVITRRFSGWRNQGEIAPNVLQRKSPVQVMVVGDSLPARLFTFEGQYVALIDKKAGLARRQIASAFAMVTPSMVKATLKQQEKLYAVNEIILDTVTGLSRNNWMIDEIELAENLTAIVIIPKAPGGE